MTRQADNNLKFIYLNFKEGDYVNIKTRQEFERAKIAEKIKFIEWSLRCIEQRRFVGLTLQNYSIQEICETTRKSEDWIKYVLEECSPNDRFTEQLKLSFYYNSPILKLSKITGMSFEKIDTIKTIQIDRPNCAKELLILYFTIQEILNGEELRDFIRHSRSRQTPKLVREKIIEKIAVFLKNKKPKAFNIAQEILGIDSAQLKKIVGYHF